MSLNGGIIVGALVAPMLLGLFLLRRDVDRLMLTVASLVAWRETNFGPEPLALVDTDEMPATHISDARTAVETAREANAPRPTPFPREGRHRA